MREELLPCPFCGEEPFGYEIEAHEHSDALKAIIPGIPDHKGSYVVECACGAGHIDDTKDACVARWNRRAAVDRASLEAVPDVDTIAQFIRTVDGNHDMGAAALAERLHEWLSAAPAQPAQQIQSVVMRIFGD